MDEWRDVGMGDHLSKLTHVHVHLIWTNIGASGRQRVDPTHLVDRLETITIDSTHNIIYSTMPLNPKVKIQDDGIHGHCWFANDDFKAGEWIWKKRPEGTTHTYNADIAEWSIIDA